MVKIKNFILGFAAGLCNSLFGAGGGIIAVTAFKSQGLEQKKAQACAVCLVLPLCLISASVYYYKGYFALGEALPYLPFGVAGALAGGLLLGKLPDKLLKKLFAVFMIYSGVRMIMR